MSKIIHDYGNFLERNPIGFEIADETELPYPKETILIAICLALQIHIDPEIRDGLIVGAMTLANFQLGVGKERLHPFGVEMTRSDVDALRPDVLAAKIISSPLGKARFEEFIPAVQSEKDQLRVRLTEIDKAFHASQGFASPIGKGP